MSVDLNDLAVFTKVVQEQSFTRAGTALGLPKSAVSRRVSRLEDRLGVRLLQRTTRRLSLTDAGQAYFERCARIIADVEDAGRVVTDMHATPRGRLRVTAPVELGVDYLSPIAGEFLTRYPDVQLDLDLTSRFVDLVAEGYDVAIRAGAALAESTLVARRIMRAPWQLVASPAYLDQYGTPSNPAQLSDHDCVIFGPSGVNAVWKLEHQRGTKSLSVPVSGRLAATNFGVVKRAALAGLGVAQMPALLCADEVDAGELTVVLPSWSAPESSLYVVYPSRRHLSAKVRVFVDFLSESFGELPHSKRAAQPDAIERRC